MIFKTYILAIVIALFVINIGPQENNRNTDRPSTPRAAYMRGYRARQAGDRRLRIEQQHMPHPRG